MKSTLEQRTASSPEHSVWVTANAGTGKTKVLTDRVLRLMLEGVPPSKILCLTFTKAAAAEMSTRISKQLSKWVTADNADLQETISSLINKKADDKTLKFSRKLFSQIVDNPNEIKIQTIHAFCQSLLGRFPLEAAITPNFKIVEEQTARELIEESWQRLFSKSNIITQKDIAIKNAINTLAKDLHDTTFKDIIKNVMSDRGKFLHLLNIYGGANNLIDKIYQQMGVAKNDIEEEIFTENCTDNSFNFTGIKSLQIALETGSKTDKERALKLANWLSSSINNRPNIYTEYRNIFLLKDKNEKKKIGSVITSKPLLQHPELEDIIQQEQERLLEIDDKIKSLRTAKLTEAIIHISEAIIELYNNMKRNRALLDYDDLIFTAEKLLQKSEYAQWIMFKLDNGIDHILVDEAQDTSPEQWRIIKALCSDFFAGEGTKENNRTIFVVGDEKQSIFSFQGADPDKFSEMKQAFGNQVESANKSWKPIAMDLSFRSSEAILNIVDSVFSSEELRKSLTDSEKLIKHLIHRKGDGGIVELWPLIRKSKNNEKPENWPLPIERIEQINTKKILAEKITHTIKKWIDDKRVMPSQGRAITAGDIMILVRKRDALVDNLVKSFKKLSINVAGIDRMILTHHIAIMDLICLGNFILLPVDDLNLATLLKSPLIGISEDELFKLAHDRGNKSLWSVLTANQNEYSGAYKFLSDLLYKNKFTTPFEFYSEILNAQNGRKKFISRMGEEVNELLDEFLNLAQSYTYNHTASLQGFISWVGAGGSEIKRDLDQGNDQIRIMTVHGSKGLQAPIIILPDTTQTPSNKGNILWDDKRDLMYVSSGKSSSNKLCGDIHDAKAKQTYDEYLRLLYVALTRAEDELYICGHETKNSKIQNWYDIVKCEMSKLGEEITFPHFNEQDKNDIGYRLISEHTNDLKKAETKKIESVNIPLPDFAMKNAPEEPIPPFPLSPSKPGGIEASILPPSSDKGIFERGNLIHLLLQYLPDIDIDKRKEISHYLIDNNSSKPMNDNDKNKIYNEVISIIEHSEYKELFSKNSIAEVPITGSDGNNIISGQIDRLVITDKEIIIADYKTHRTPPKNNEDIPPIYIKQMLSYKKLISDIYPNRKIRCILIWTNSTKISEL